MLRNCCATTLSVGIVLVPLIGITVLGCSEGPSEHGIGPGGRTRPGAVFTDPGVRALADAAGKGDVKEIDRLVASGVDANASGNAGVTPLVWAMAARNHEGFVRLLERGADPNQQHPEIDTGEGSSAMSIAASSVIDSFFLEAALKHGGNPNLVEPRDKTTPIYKAIMSGKIKNLDLLIAAGADLNHKGGHFASPPLTDAAVINWYEGVFRLLEAGADYRITDNAGTSVADFAVLERVHYTAEVRRWKDKVLDLLEAKGADLEAARRAAEAMGIRTKKWTDEEWARKTPHKGSPIPKEKPRSDPEP